MTWRLITSFLGGLALMTITAEAYTPSNPPTRTLGDAPISPAPAQAAHPVSSVAPRRATSLPTLTLDTSSRRAARNFYNAIYGQSDGIAANWTGNVASDIPGDTDADFKSAVALRVNFFRAFAGVPGDITLNSTWNGEAQQGALMMSANDALNHHPPTSWTDYSSAGATAASSSNLALGNDGPNAVTAYIEDTGSNNTEVGHRRWVLYPETQQMGTGDIPFNGSNPSANDLWVFDFGHPYPAPRDGFVAWPPKGYVPYQFLYPRWSFSLQNADFSKAKVTVSSGGASIGTTIISSTADGYGDNTLVWTLAGAPDGSIYAAPSGDTTYTVTVSNVMLNSVAQSYTYNVTVFDPSVPGTDDILPTLSAPTTVGVGSTTSLAFTTLPEASGYELWNATLQNAAWVEGAETTPYHLTAQTTGTYSPVTSSAAASGSACFQLCQDNFNNQDLLLNSSFVANSTSAISFQARYGYMSPTQLAQVQVSLDDGSSWNTVFSRAGTNQDTGTFAPQTVSLAAYAHRIIRLRFLLNFTGGQAYTQTGVPDVGWLIDNITPVNLAEASSASETAVSTSPASFTAPASTGVANLAVRAVLFGQYPLEYGPVASFDVAGTSTTPSITSASSATGTYGASFSYTITTTTTGSPTTFSASGLPAGLSLNVGTGVISGSPTAAGTSSVTLSATNTSTGEVGHAVVTFVMGKAAAMVTVPTQSIAYSGAAHSAEATTQPAGLALTFTYNGSATAPTALGTYTVVATVADANYQGSGQGTLSITPATPGITLTGLTATYTGRAHPAQATTVPPGLPVKLTYNGQTAIPVNAGTYDVAATVMTPTYAGTASGTMTILPAAVTGVAKAITGRTASLSGTVSSAAVVTGATFEYGTDTTYGGTLPATAETAGGSTLVETATLSGLAPGTVYHYRLDVASTPGLSVGVDKTFTTMPAPVLEPAPQVCLSATGVEIGQKVNPSGYAATIVFNYGTTPGLGESTAAQVIRVGKTDVTILALFPGLLPSTLYYYQAVTTSAAGTFTGPLESFITPGFDLMLVVAQSSVLDGITANKLGDPAVNVDEHVAFALNEGTSSAAVMFDDGSTTTAIASYGETAAGAGAATFATLGDPAINANDAVAFRATLKPAAGQAGVTSGVWVTNGGSPQLVAGVDGTVPLAAGGTGTLATVTGFGLSDAGVIVAGTLKPSTTPLINTTNNAGIWFEPSGGNLQEMVRLGDVVATPSGSGTITQFTFLPASDPYVVGQTRSFAAANGSLVYGVSFSNKSTGLVKQSVGGSPRLVAISGTTYESFGPPAINNQGHVAFAGVLAPSTGATSTSNRGIWADDSNGTRQLVARSGMTAQGLSSTFATLSDPVYNNHEAVAFRATLQGSPATGIWATDANGQGLAKVAVQGGAAAGCPAGAVFSTFGQLALPDQGGPSNLGGVLFTATITGMPGSSSGVTPANNAGIWAVDSNGEVQLIVRTGSVLQGKVVTALSFLPGSTTAGGQDRSFTAERGDLVFRAVFSDKTAAVYNVIFP